MKILHHVAVCLLFASVVALSSGCETWDSIWGSDDDKTAGDTGALGEGGGTAVPDPFGEPGVGPKSADKWTPIPGVKFAPVYFAYDQATIGTSEQAKIQEVAKYLQEHSDVCLIIEGHCDERGSLEYNRALGERRAIAVRDAMAGYGIQDNRMQTISYGEERPAVQGSGEAVWAKNRRGEMVPAK